MVFIVEDGLEAGLGCCKNKHSFLVDQLNLELFPLVVVDCILVAGYFKVDNDGLIVLCGYLEGNSIQQAVDVIRLIFLLYYLDIL